MIVLVTGKHKNRRRSRNVALAAAAMLAILRVSFGLSGLWEYDGFTVSKTFIWLVV